MMVDRRLAGVLGIATVLSTLVSIAIYRPQEMRAVEVAVNTFPANLPVSGYGRPRFVNDLVATTDLPDVVVAYAMLRRIGPDLARPWNQISRSGEDLARNVLVLDALEDWLQRCRDAGLESSAVRREIRVRANGSDAVLHVSDYTQALENFGAGPDQLGTADTVWAFLVQGSGSVATYAGVSDFFLDRLNLVYSLEISHGTEAESYASDKVPPELRGQKPPIDQAPPTGVVHKQGLAEGDRLHIAFDLIGERMFRHDGLLQLVSIRTGLGEDVLVNFIGASSG